MFFQHRAVVILYVFFVVYSYFNAVIADSYEPDNTLVSASTITAGTTQTRSITPATDEDWVKFTLSQSEYVEIKTSGPLITRVALYDQYQNRIAISNGFKPGNVQALLNPGTYYIQVYDSGASNEVEYYYLTLLTTLSGGDQHEADNKFQDANLITPENITTHSIFPTGDRDWGRIVLNKTEYIELKSSGLSNTRIAIYDQYLTRLAISNGFVPGNIKIKLDAGTYYSVVYNSSSLVDTIDPYYFVVSTTLGGGDSYEADNKAEDATLITANGTQTHSIYPAGDNDWFRFDLSQDDNVVMTTSGATITRIALYDANLNRITISNGFQAGYVQRNLDAGTYYAVVTASASGNTISEYQFHINASHLSPNPAGANAILPALQMLMPE